MPQVLVPAPRAEVFAYLADPTRRPEWQASLRSVELLDPNPPHVGQRWVDHLYGGARFTLHITELEEGRVWTEEGRQGPLDAQVRLRFEDAVVDGEPGTRVTVEIRFTGRGAARPLGPLAGAALRGLIRIDLPRIRRAFAG